MASLNFDTKDIKSLLGGLKLGEAPDTTMKAPGALTPPPMAPAGPPPPPQPTPAVAGFSEWSADPANQQKVAHGITPPGQPIIPQNAATPPALTPPPSQQPFYGTVSKPTTYDVGPLAGKPVADMLRSGNYDLNHLPGIKNADGSHSSIFSMTVPVGADDKSRPWGSNDVTGYALVPSIKNGRFLTPDGKKPNEKDSKAMGYLEDAATRDYDKTGQQLGIFSSSDAADRYATATHEYMSDGTPRKVYTPSYAGSSPISSTQAPMIHPAPPASLTPPPNPSGPTMASISGPPNMPAAVTPSVTPAPDPLQTKLNADQNELARLQKTGSGVSQIKNPVLRTLATIGDIAGTTFLPGAALATPGTSLHHYMLEGKQQDRVANDQAAIKDAANLADIQSQTQERLGKANKANAQADAVGDPTTQHAKQITDLAKQGLKPVYDANGVLTGVAPDENSPKYQADQAHIGDMKAQKALRDAQTEVEKAKNDPNSPAYKFALQKLAVAQQNAAAAQKRATAYMGRYMQSAYNVGLDGNVLPGTPIINDASGNETAVGTANANNAIKQQGATVTFNDLQGSAAHARAALDALHKSGGDLSDPLVIAAMQDPTSLTGKMVNGQLVKPNLSQQQIEAIGALNQLREQIGILRAATKGTAAEAQTERMLATLPTAGDTKATAINKMDELNGVMGRVRPGVTRVSGGQKVNGLTPPPSGGGNGMITMKLSNGQTGQIHSSQKARFIRDNPGAVEVTNVK